MTEPTATPTGAQPAMTVTRTVDFLAEPAAQPETEPFDVTTLDKVEPVTGTDPALGKYRERLRRAMDEGARVVREGARGYRKFAELPPELPQETERQAFEGFQQAYGDAHHTAQQELSDAHGAYREAAWRNVTRTDRLDDTVAASRLDELKTFLANTARRRYDGDAGNITESDLAEFARRSPSHAAILATPAAADTLGLTLRAEPADVTRTVTDVLVTVAPDHGRERAATDYRALPDVQANVSLLSWAMGSRYRTVYGRYPGAWRYNPEHRR